ncbi:MAG: anaerobic ribonucleoside-triphosphate reductase activating protein [Muribaculaceae bacterium]|nr:anaerobic ribonucleoside-triphosphate reductase activating protein [Muribaculaceae bacterium]
MSDKTLRVLRIVDGTSVDGPGLRTSIYLAGCSHACAGCHNMQSWDFAAGDEMSIDEIVEHVELEGYNVTLSGGDPLYQADALLPLLAELKARGYNVWCYTGFTYEQVYNDVSMKRVLDYVDVLVDGPFVMSERDITLRFRGSANQRLIDVAASRPGNIVQWAD